MSGKYVFIDAQLSSDLSNADDVTRGDALVAVKSPLAGATARTQHDKNQDFVSIFDFMTSDQIADVRAKTNLIDVSSALTAAVAAADLIYFPPGSYRLNSEVTIDRSITLIGSAGNEYGSEGVTIYVAHNNAALAGLKVGYSNNNIRFEMNGFKFDAPAVSGAAYAGLRCTAATVYISGLQGSANINCAYFLNCYIGSVDKLSGYSKNFLCSVNGNVSLRFGTVNVGSSTGGSAAFQVAITDGYLVIDHIYLEAQTTRNLSISCTEVAAMRVANIYGENSSFYDVSISNSQNVTIENYRTNAATKSIVITNSSAISIDKIHVVARFESNEVVSIDDSSYGIFVGGVLFNPIYNDGFQKRFYAMVRGPVAGRPAPSMIVNPTLMLSANGTTSTVGGSGVTTNVPTVDSMKFSAKSITVNAANPIKIPFTRWRNKGAIAITLIYRQTSAYAGVNDVYLKIQKNGATTLWEVTDFAVNDLNVWKQVNLVAYLDQLSVAQLDQYSSIEVWCTGAATAEVHYLNCHLYDGGELPFGFVDESAVFESAPVTLATLNSTAVLVPRVGGMNYRFKGYELVYDTNTNGGTTSTVAVGDFNGAGGLANAYANFTSEQNKGAGLPCSVLAAPGPYPFRDHWLGGANGWCVSVTANGTMTGTARAYIRAVQMDANSGG